MLVFVAGTANRDFGGAEAGGRITGAGMTRTIVCLSTGTLDRACGCDLA